MQDHVLKMKDLPPILNMSIRTIYTMRAQGTFPPARRLSPKRVGWLASDIQEWVRNRPVVGGGMEGMQ